VTSSRQILGTDLGRPAIGAHGPRVPAAKRAFFQAPAALAGRVPSRGAAVTAGTSARCSQDGVGVQGRPDRAGRSRISSETSSRAIEIAPKRSALMLPSYGCPRSLRHRPDRPSPARLVRRRGRLLPHGRRPAGTARMGAAAYGTIARLSFTDPLASQSQARDDATRKSDRPHFGSGRPRAVACSAELGERVERVDVVSIVVAAERFRHADRRRRTRATQPLCAGQESFSIALMGATPPWFEVL